ncbi:MAG: Gfo/Idh/MocA family oxidoreductase [Stigonema ocellatum SAG 48.90 = DSM 106950]|nr:Gfo/Idh/MocA family oxidoreductase [Stigonema ocellatum SAG 48.90 = DSM 106950]
MNFFDLREFSDNALIETDICIVGSGTVGLSIAKEFAGTNVDVLVLESGGLKTEEQTQKLYDIESVGDLRIINQENLRRRILGGSSSVWTGRCAPFDEYDFEYRDWIQYSGWPIDRRELDPYLERAGEYLGLGPHCYNEKLWQQFKVNPPKPSLNQQFLEPVFWQFSKSPSDPNTSVNFGRDLAFPKAPNINLLLHANVIHINTNAEATQFKSVEVSTLEGKKGLVQAKVLVLGCGGIENARLLLASNRLISQGLGNQHDLVGRFLMDHTLYVLGHFDPEDADRVRDRFGFYWLDNEKGRHTYLHGVSLSQEIQRSEHLLKCHAYIEEYDLPDDNPWVSMKRLKSTLKSTLKSRKISQTTKQDAQVLISNFGDVSRGLHRRIMKHRPQLSRARRIELHCMLEQLPDPNSRIKLSQARRDSLGIPISEIDWKISDLERQTALKMGQLIVQEFPLLNLPVPHLSPWINNEENWKNYFGEKAHPTGSTRLSTNPKVGVVDTNLQVHGIAGIFVAGSSVFPTSGAVNPTLMIVALSIRLADWLKATLFKQHSAQATESKLFPTLKESYIKPPATSREGAPIKIGLVGAGQRISEMYWPILRHQAENYEVVGFTTQSEHRAREFASKTGISVFSSPAELVQQQNPDFLISCVASTFNEATLMNLLDLQVPILTETPLAWSVTGGGKILKKAAINQTKLAVAEQFPFLPLEQFKQQLIAAGIFGDIYAAHNDFSSYRYHGIAQLRRYFKGKPISVRSVDYGFGVDPHYYRSQPQWSNIQWQMGTVTFDDRAVFFHHYSDHYAVSDLCFPQTIRLYGKSGTMVDYDVRYFNQHSGRVEMVKAIRKENGSGNLVSIEASLPDVGTITWENPFAAHPFTDEQIAVATILKAMALSVSTGTSPLYTAEDFLTDISIMQALHYSAQRNGAEITLPFNEIAQKALVVVKNRLKK